MSTNLQNDIDFTAQEKKAQAINDAKVKATLGKNKSTYSTKPIRVWMHQHHRLKSEAAYEGVSMTEYLGLILEKYWNIKN